jgi:hypothetical protein
MQIADLFHMTDSDWLAEPDSRTDSVLTPAGTDIQDYTGPTLIVDIFVEGIATGTTKTLDITFQHNDVATYNDAGWADIDADALIDSDGDATTVTQITTTDSTQRVGLKKERLKQYIRVVLTCGSADVVHVGAVLLTSALRYVNFTQ